MADNPEPYPPLKVTIGSGQMRLLGPIVNVGVRAPESEREVQTIMLLDTGASRSHIASGLATRLRLKPLAPVLVTWPDREGESVPQFACIVSLPGAGGIIEHNFTAAPHLDPAEYGIILGRDLMKEARIIVDFATGVWEWHRAALLPTE